MTEPKSLQETYGPGGHCFGCGPRNEKGLRIRSLVEGDEVICRWLGRPEHQAWEGALNGGIVGCLFDCHSNWTAAWHLWEAGGRDGEFPSTVTAEFRVRLERPTDSKHPVTIRSRVAEASKRSATIESVMTDAEGNVTATCRGTFVSVPPGHPAYHRWQ